MTKRQKHRSLPRRIRALSALRNAKFKMRRKRKNLQRRS
jgi:hypothetical protein